MGAPNTFFTTLALAVSLIGFLFANTIFNVEEETDVRHSIKQDCYSIAEAAQDYFCTPTLLGGTGRSYPDICLTQCGVEKTETGYRGETDIATYTVEGDAERFTVTGVLKANPRQTVVLSCLMTRPDGERLSLVTANW